MSTDRGKSGQRLSVDVTVPPVLDDEGHEQVGETPQAIPEVPSFTMPAQQPQQQQQQQQQ